MKKHGFSLVELLIVVAIITIFFLIGTTIFNSHSQTSIEGQVFLTMSRLQLQIEQELVNRNKLDKTLNDPANADFKACHPESSAGTCYIDKTDFSLLDSSGLKITGTEAAPVYYNYKGEICSTPNSVCFFKVYTKFLADCGVTAGPTPILSCAKSKSLKIKYFIKQADGQAPVTGTPLRPFESSYIPIYITRATSCLASNDSLIVSSFSGATVAARVNTGPDLVTEPASAYNGGMWVKVKQSNTSSGYSLKVLGMNCTPGFPPAVLTWIIVGSGDVNTDGTDTQINFKSMRSGCPEGYTSNWQSECIIEWEGKNASGDSISGETSPFFIYLKAN